MNPYIIDDCTIACAICGQHMKAIGWRHLQKVHDMTLTDYALMFPNAPIRSTNSTVLKKTASRRANESRRGVPRSAAVREKIKKTKAEVKHPAWNKGIPMSEDRKVQLSQRMKEDFATGKRTHHNQGKSLPTSVKEKIKKTLMEKYAESNARKLEEANHKKQVLNESIQLAADVVEQLGIEMRFEIKSNSNTISRMNTIAEHFHTLKEHDNVLVAVTDVLCAPQLLRYHINCGTCGTRFTITNQYIRPNKLNVRANSMCPTCTPRTRSAGEIEMADYITSLLPNESITYNNRTVLSSGAELDVFIESRNLAFEYNGLYWHSEDISRTQCNIFKKYDRARLQGIRVVNIFEDEWLNNKELCKSRIRQILGVNNDNVIHGRQLKVDLIDLSTAKDFLRINHIQGAGRSAHLAVGAFHDDELVAVMSFSNTTHIKGNNKAGIELLRYACKLGYRINGGASKMFKFAVREFGFSSVVSYCDLRWNTGSVYAQLGFVKTHTSPPNYWYVKQQKRLHRANFMKHKLKDKLDTYDPSLTEAQNMVNNGYQRVWDCGNTVWAWPAPN